MNCLKERDSKTGIDRRDFLAVLPIVACAGGFKIHSSVTGIQEKQKPVLPDQLSDEEKEWTQSYTMSRELGKYFGAGYNCAESLLTVSLKHLNKSPELVWLAAGFGGGMLHKSLCGFLTAGIMSLGLYCGNLDLERREAKKICSGLVKKYWEWWNSTAPVNCEDIRTADDGKGTCMRLGYLAAARVQSLMEEKA